MDIASWITLRNERRIVLSGRSAFVAVTMDLLRELMTDHIATIVVDEAWYLDYYPDVAAAVRQGVVAGAAMHYVQSGYFEDRMPYPIVVDEPWYLDQNADVAAAAAKGLFQSAQEHFEAVGYREGRPPYPGFRLNRIAQ